jgi:hypothetical protein
MAEEKIMATSGNPLAPNPETDVDNPRPRENPREDIESGEVTEPGGVETIHNE